MKIAINKSYGGFSLSPAATLKLYERGVIEIATHVDQYWPVAGRAEQDAKWPMFGYRATLQKWREYLASGGTGRDPSLTVFSPDESYVLNAGREIERHHPELIRLIEEMGAAAGGPCAQLDIVEIPDDIEYVVEEYDGREWIAETHRTWS